MRLKFTMQRMHVGRAQTLAFGYMRCDNIRYVKETSNLMTQKSRHQRLKIPMCTFHTHPDATRSQYYK